MPVHPPTSGVAQDRSGDASVDGPVDRATDRRRQRDWNDPGALADNPQHPVAVFFAEVGGIGAGRFKDPQPQQTEHRERAQSLSLADSRPAVSNASSCRWVSPRVGDSGGTVGRRKYSAGECSRTPSMKQVR